MSKATGMGRDSLLLSGVAQASGPTAAVTWNMLSNVVAEGMKSPAQFGAAIAALDPTCCVAVFGLATVCGVVRHFRGKRSAEESARLHEEIRRLAERAAQGRDVLQDIADGTIELKVNVDDFVKADIAACVAGVAGRPGSPVRLAIREELSQALKEWAAAPQLVHLGRSFPEFAETVEILLWTQDHRGREHSEMLGEIVAWIRSGGSATAARATDNLAKVGATRNQAFVGRVEALDQLERLLVGVNSVNAVAITAGAGFGKSELAREFVNGRCTTRTEDPDGWNGRWWLDGSTGGERTAAPDLYAAMTGREPPTPPDPKPEEDAAAMWSAYWRSLRGLIAEACSNGRHLLILDNAETAEQIGAYRPANAGRLLATTRRQPIAASIAIELPLEELSFEDARRLLRCKRSDLEPARHDAALDAIATHLGRHALALAYTAAALVRVPYRSPDAVLEALQSAEVGDEAHILSEFKGEQLGTQYKLPLAQSLGFLLEELADPASATCDPLAVDLAGFAAFCHPNAIPWELLEKGFSTSAGEIGRALGALHERSIVTVRVSPESGANTISMHLLTQSLLRGRLLRRGPEEFEAAAVRVIQCLDGFYSDWADHTLSSFRTSLWPHAEAALDRAAVRGIGTGPDSSAPATSSPPPTPSVTATTPAVASSQLCSNLGSHLQDIGALREANGLIDRSITWGEKQTPRDERSLAIWYASRARIRQDRGDLDGAKGDIDRSITWGEQQTPRDERGLAIWYASRASIRQDRGDLDGARQDIKRALDWYTATLPDDTRSIGIMSQIKESIERASGG